MSYSILSEEPVGKVLAVKFVISLKEEIKICVLLWGCSPPGMRGLWWEGSDDWSAVVMDPGFLKGPGGSSRTAQGFGMEDGSEQCECWAGDCLPQGHHQEDEAFARQLEQALVHRPTSWGILISWVSARRASQQGVWGAFWSSGMVMGNQEQVTEHLAKGDTLQSLSCQEELVGNVNVGSRLQESPSLEIFRTHLDIAVSNLLQLTLFYAESIVSSSILCNVLLTVWNRIGSVTKARWF